MYIYVAYIMHTPCLGINNRRRIKTVCINTCVPDSLLEHLTTTFSYVYNMYLLSYHFLLQKPSTSPEDEESVDKEPQETSEMKLLVIISYVHISGVSEWIRISFNT
jgi:hypothetical protein